jgi:tetratricopeptide (TPR) repeat protein
MYELVDLEKAAYHFDLALKFAPAFPDTYFAYLYLLMKVNDNKRFFTIWDKAATLGVTCKGCLCQLKGQLQEQNARYTEAIALYKNALMHSVDCGDSEEHESAIKRVQEKQRALKKYNYV